MAPQAPAFETQSQGIAFYDPAVEDNNTFRQLQRAGGPAMILAIGKANPKTCYQQSKFAEFYFRVSNKNHDEELKKKMSRICDKSGMKERYLYLTEELLKENPDICDYSANSLDARQAMGVRAVPELGAEAAEMALEEWGRNRSLITHVVFASSCGVHMPGADLSMSILLGLRQDVQRVMVYNQGCYSGGTILRIAKDLAENNAGARVLAVASEITIDSFRCPSPEVDHPSLLVGSALFSDGAGAMIIGSDPLPSLERPIFQVHCSLSTFAPNTARDIEVKLTQSGLVYYISKELPTLVAKNTPTIFEQALKHAGNPDYNDIFWCVHPGGRKIIDELDEMYKLKPEKMAATRDILRHYGNMFGAGIVFVMDRLRKRAKEHSFSTTGDGCKWGLVLGMGPGLTLEVTLLKAIDT